MRNSKVQTDEGQTTDTDNETVVETTTNKKGDIQMDEQISTETIDSEVPGSNDLGDAPIDGVSDSSSESGHEDPMSHHEDRLVEAVEETVAQPVKRGRGRPKKTPSTTIETQALSPSSSAEEPSVPEDWEDPAANESNDYSCEDESDDSGDSEDDDQLNVSDDDTATSDGPALSLVPLEVDYEEEVSERSDSTDQDLDADDDTDRGIDQKAVELATCINEEMRGTYGSNWEALPAIGKILFVDCFHSNEADYRNNKPNKSMSLRRIVMAGSDLSVSTLSDCVRLYLERESLPAGVQEFLSTTHALILLQAPREEWEEIARQAISEKWSTRRLRIEITRRTGTIDKPNRQASKGSANDGVNDQEVDGPEPAAEAVALSETDIVAVEGVATGPDQILLQDCKRWVETLDSIVIIPKKFRASSPSGIIASEVAKFDKGVFAGSWNVDTARSIVETTTQLIRYLNIVKKYACEVQKGAVPTTAVAA